MDFGKFIGQLNRRMMEEHIAVDGLKNPISQSANELNADAMRFVLEQYSFFSKNISSFLMDAYFVMAHEGWMAVAAELTKNINEEFGHNEEGSAFHCLKPEKADRVPHYILLRRGIKEGLGVDVALATPSAATAEFIIGIKGVMNDLRAAYVAGGTYALESSAVPELQMVYGFAKKLFSELRRSMPKPMLIFFESHIDELEVGHEQRLREVCESYISLDEQREVFEAGFLKLISVMDDWWLGLYQEISCLRQHAA